MLTQETGEVRQERIVPGERAIEIEHRQRGRSSRRGGGRRGGRVRIRQAALPAAASCRSTNCRIPPWR
jgi:hypothetical protein